MGIEGFSKICREHTVGELKCRAQGWKCLSTTTVNRVDSIGWKHLSRFYLAPLRRCVKCQEQNRNWGRAWLVNVKCSTPRKTEALFCHRGQLFRIICVSSSHQQQHKQHLWWHQWLGNITRMRMSLERSWFMLYLPRNLTQKVLRCVLIWAALVVRGTKLRETISIWFAML